LKVQVPKQQIIQTIKEYDTIIIHRHVRPDADALGSQCGLREILQQSYPDKNIYVVGEEDPSLHFLARMDDIENDVYAGSLVIVCDTANTGRISDQRYHLGEKIIKIDHHPNHEAYGDIVWVDTTASSTSEMIYELYKTDANANFIANEEMARLLYAGIVGDTGRFLFPSTKNVTFQVAAELIEYPFDRSALYNGLYNVEQHIARLRGYVLQHFTLSANGVSTMKLTKDILHQFNVKPNETSKLVGTLGDIENMKAWAFFIEEEEVIRVRIRSKGPIINELAAKYRGGGHPLASGATVTSWDEADQFIQDLEAICAQA